MSGAAVPNGEAPRWPRERRISPSALRTYGVCPFRVRLEHLEHVTPPFRFNLTLSKGRVAHVILKRVADALAHDRAPIDDGEMLVMARRHLPRQEFPSPDEHEAQALDVVRWAAAGRRYLELLPDASYLLVERGMSRPWKIIAGEPTYTISARPDVVLLRQDADGAPLVEVIDYKTGKVPREPDPEAPVLMRFVLRDVLAQHLGNPSAARVRFVYLWLDTDDRTEIDLTLDHCHQRWDAITQGLQALASESAWAPRPSRLCRYCPFYGNACIPRMPAES